MASEPAAVAAADGTDGPAAPAAAAAAAEREDAPAAEEPGCTDPGVPADNLRIVSRAPRRMGRRWPTDWYRESRTLQQVVGCLVCTVFVLLIVALFLWARILEPSIPAVIHSSRTGPAARVCDTPGCLQRAAETVRFLNVSADPCADFYQFACGGFSAAYPRGTLRPYSVREMLEERNEARLLALLREEQYFNTSGSGAAAQAKVFFSTCVSAFEEGMNHVQALVDLVQRVGGLELFGTWTIQQRKTRSLINYPDETQFDFNDVFGNVSALIPDQVFFELEFDRELNVLALELPKLAMGFVEGVARPGSVVHERMTARLRARLRLLLGHLEQESPGVHEQRSCGGNCVDVMVEDILAVQDALSVLRPDLQAEEEAAALHGLSLTEMRVLSVLRPDLQAEEAAVHGLSLAELRELTPQIDWRRLLDQRYGAGTVPDKVSVRVPSAEYMAGIGRLIDDTRYQRLYHYLVWHVIRGYLVGLGPVYATFSAELDQGFSDQPLRSRDAQCLRLLERHMEPALRALLISARGGDQSQLPAARQLIKQVHGPLIDSFAWMTEHSQSVSKNLLEMMHVDFGEPPSALGPVDDYFAPLRFNTFSESFFFNLQQLYQFSAPVRVTLSPLPEGAPPLESAVARFDLARRTLLVPHGALQTPWFDASVPAPLNAAALGSFALEALAVPFLLVHQMANGTSQWDEETRWRLDEFTTCLTDAVERAPLRQDYQVAFKTGTTESTEHHFQNFTVDFPADFVGFVLLRDYFAYQLTRRLYRRLSELEPAVDLPGLHLNSTEQGFYLAYAQARCHNGHLDEEQILDMGKRPMVPPHIVINSLVYSDAEFARAFQCEARRPDASAAVRDISACRLFQWPEDATGAPHAAHGTSTASAAVADEM